MNVNNRESVCCDTEERILHAAEHEFLAKGFAGARTTTIAAAAGVTHAMFHYYFRTKERLFERIMVEKFGLIKDIMTVPLEDFDLSLEEVLRRMIDRHMDFLTANADLPRFFLTEVYAAPERAAVVAEQIRVKGEEVIGLLKQKIDAEAQAGRCRRVEAHMLMLDIVSLNVFAFMAWPVLGGIMDAYDGDMSRFINARKAENFKTIISKLKP